MVVQQRVDLAMHPTADATLFAICRKKALLSNKMDYDEKKTSNVNAMSASGKARPSIRHIEKRRTSTCQFADRIAEISIRHYRKIVPKEHQGTSTCLAAVLAHDSRTDSFIILGMVRYFITSMMPDW